MVPKRYTMTADELRGKIEYAERKDAEVYQMFFQNEPGWKASDRVSYWKREEPLIWVLFVAEHEESLAYHMYNLMQEDRELLLAVKDSFENAKLR